MLPDKNYSLPLYSFDYGISGDSSIDPSGSSMLNAFPAKSKKLLARVVTDRISFLKDVTDELKHMASERAKLAEMLKLDIDMNMCQVSSELYGIDLTDARRNSLENRIMDLCKEKRDQDLSLWKDTVGLKQELWKAQKELRTAMLDLWMIRFLS